MERADNMLVNYNEARPNISLQPTGCFLRFGGHPELTIQECANAETRIEND